MINIKHIEEAYDRIKDHISRTRLEKSYYLSDGDTEAYMKLECEQSVVKSFKIRGVLGKLTLLTEEQLKNGYGTISSGNQGVCVSYASKLLNLDRPFIVVPENTPKPKLEKMTRFDADIHYFGHSFDEANGLGEAIFEEKGIVKIDAREDVEGLYGAGTIALEILQDLPDIDVLLIPKGSGGNTIANGSYMRQAKPGVKIYCVEPENSPALTTNLKTGVWTKFFDAPEDAIMQSLIGGCAKNTFDNAAECIDDILLVSDDEVRQAVYELAQNEKVIAEPDSASVYAAYKRYRHLFEGKKTAMIVTGGNISKELFKEIISTR